MEKIKDKKHFQKYFSTKFLVELSWNFLGPETPLKKCQNFYLGSIITGEYVF